MTMSVPYSMHTSFSFVLNIYQVEMGTCKEMEVRDAVHACVCVSMHMFVSATALTLSILCIHCLT